MVTHVLLSDEYTYLHKASIGPCIPLIAGTLWGWDIIKVAFCTFKHESPCGTTYYEFLEVIINLTTCYVKHTVYSI